MSKNSILIGLSSLFLIGAIIFNYKIKSNFDNSLKSIKKEGSEIVKVAKLKDLWGAKGVKTKLQKIIDNVPSSKRKEFLVKRSRANIKLNALSDKELNRVLTKLSMLPIQFKNLLITKNRDNFSMECLCVW